MKRCIKYYRTKSPLKFLIKPWKFYYYKPAGIYLMRSDPIIYMKEFGEHVDKIQIYDCFMGKEIPFYNPDFFELSTEDYLIVTYKDGSMKKFQLEFYSYGLLELTEKSLDT